MSHYSLAIPADLVEELATQVARRIVPSADVREPWLNVDLAAEYLACSKRRIYDLVGREAVVCHRDGKRLLFRREDLDACVSMPKEQRH